MKKVFTIIIGKNKIEIKRFNTVSKKIENTEQTEKDLKEIIQIYQSELQIIQKRDDMIYKLVRKEYKTWLVKMYIPLIEGLQGYIKLFK
ncbi:hypothetical protein [Enterococcus sp. AZ192]|uniref:hypothetical protein n=1 Tax=unclassified Enterococcus TaxID=2608891 RepID=UPI003D275B9E